MNYLTTNVIEVAERERINGSGQLPIGFGNHTHEAMLALCWLNPYEGDFMGELISTGNSEDEAIKNHIGMLQTLGYDGRITYDRIDGEVICDVEFNPTEKPKVLARRESYGQTP